MDVVAEWTGRHAAALRQALRLTNEMFAEQLGTAVRTVARWNADPDLVPVIELQRALDTVFDRASEDEKARFARSLTALRSPTTAPTTDDAPPTASPAPHGGPRAADLEQRLSSDRQIGEALEWIDRHAGWPAGQARRRTAGASLALDPRELQDRGHRRGQVGRREIAAALRGYYSTGLDGFRPFTARCAGQPIETSMLTRERWLDLGIPLGTPEERFDLRSDSKPGPSLDETQATAAVHRVAEVVATGMRMVNAPLYRLASIDISPGAISGTVAIAHFVDYALTLDLLESELVDAIAEHRPTEPGALPLRDRYLPDVPTITDVDARVCAGGPLALLAVARPGPRRRGTGPDYLLLVQERSGRVLNAARRLAVIPKCFHGPLVDYDEDAPISASLEREMEEELFGRDDVDSALARQRHADPMHPARLSDPMRWLVERAGSETWRMECTGFGLNLVSGNFECASLLVIEDEQWWERFGGHIAANWESDGLRRYSSRDRSQLAALAHDPAWSNEGLFALLQGFRSLARTGGDRVDLPEIETETT